MHKPSPKRLNLGRNLLVLVSPAHIFRKINRLQDDEHTEKCSHREFRNRLHRKNCKAMRPRFAATKAAINGGGQEEERGVGSSAVRKKNGAGVKAWLLLDEHGNAQVVEVGKHMIMRRTGLPARDLRILDPLLSYPSSILGRERAIVINLEHIKAIITAHEVLLLNSRDPAVAPFAALLQRRLLQPSCTPAHQEGENSDMDMELSKSEMANDGEISQLVDENSFPENPDTKIDDLKLEMNAFDNCPKVLPFEFRVLEACLEAACSSLESETGVLEEEAYPALDELTSKVSTLKLERIRQIKSRLVAISGRVQKVRDELEHLLDDDEDMAEMYLTDKLMQQLDGISSPTSFHGARGGVEHELAHSDAEDESVVEALSGTFNILGGDKERNTISRTHSGSKDLDVEELEMLLEAYFVQIDGTLNKLLALREYVDDTEDYINIMLDDKQNHLLQMGVMLTTTTLIISLFVVVAGIMGMNVRISLFNTGFPQWLQIVIGSTISCIFLDIVAIAWFKHKRLL